MTNCVQGTRDAIADARAALSRDNQHALPKESDAAIIIDGKTLKHALTHALRQDFLEICCSCRAVICCRASPIQKAEVSVFLKCLFLIFNNTTQLHAKLVGKIKLKRVHPNLIYLSSFLADRGVRHKTNRCNNVSYWGWGKWCGYDSEGSCWHWYLRTGGSPGCLCFRLCHRPVFVSYQALICARGVELRSNVQIDIL